MWQAKVHTHIHTHYLGSKKGIVLFDGVRVDLTVMASQARMNIQKRKIIVFFFKKISFKLS